MTTFAAYQPYGLSRRPRWKAVGLTAGLEIALVLGVLYGAARHVQQAEPAVLAVSLMAPVVPPTVPIQRRMPDVPPPRAKALPQPELTLPVVNEPAPAPAPAPIVASTVTPPVMRPAEPAAVPVAPPPPAASAAPSAEYIAKVRAAVQAAFEYPMAAKAQDFKGRARVAFTLSDTRPSSTRIVVSSGMGIVDKAALKAVEGASYPPAPEPLNHVDQAFEVWVNFGA